MWTAPKVTAIHPAIVGQAGSATGRLAPYVGASSRVGDVVRAIAQRGTACWGDRVRRGRAAHGMESFARGDLAAEERSTLTSRSRPLP